MDHQNINAKMELKSMQIGSSMLVQKISEMHIEK